MSAVASKDKNGSKKSKSSKEENDSVMSDISNDNNGKNDKIVEKDEEKEPKKIKKNKNDKNNNNNDDNNNDNNNNNDKIKDKKINKIAKQKNDAYGKILLAKQLKELQKSADGFSVGLKDDDNLYEWELIVEGPAETLYEGGYFSATLSFPQDFPSKPPKMVFTTPGFWHPNVYKDGKVCISILHEAKEDQFNQQESMDEKWRPILSVEAIIISVLSMLSEPNFSSPANIDASVEWKKNPEQYKKKIRRLVRKSQEIMMGG